jgi:ElaB/YqjD/DUF883 family membrane-anchored ribosome-binding protein
MSRSVSSIEELRDELQSQIADLGSELRSLRKSVARRSASRYEDLYDGAGDLLDEMWSRISDNLPSSRQVRRHARSAGRTVQEHPGTTAATALVGIAVLGLLFSLLLRR